MNRTLYNNGFTILELLVIISIIGLLASIILAFLNQAKVSARDARRKADIETVRKAIDGYFQDNALYPPASGGGGVQVGFDDSVLTAALVPTYIQQMPRDPGCPAGTGTCATNYQYLVSPTQNISGVYASFEGIAPCKFVTNGNKPAWFNNAPYCGYQ